MYIKLSFTQDKHFQDCARYVDDIINWTTTTSITALMTRVQTVYGTGLAAGFSTSTSDLVRTVNVTPSLTKSHFYAQNLSTGIYRWTLMQTSYDTTTTNYYAQMQGTALSAGIGVAVLIGNAITGGTMSSSSCPITVAYLASNVNGTALTIAGSTYGGASVGYAIGNTTSGQTSIRHFWMYINDKCIIFAFVNNTSYNNGWPSAFNSAANMCGPFFLSQYTRFDYWNKDSNGIIPLMFNDFARGAGIGFGIASDFNDNGNVYYAQGNATSLPLIGFNTVNAFPAVTSSWPLVYSFVPMPIWGYRDAYVATAATGYTYSVAGSTYTTVTYGKGISNTAAERWPNADLSGTSFQIIALSWSSDRYGAVGGNISDRSGWYLFNGDYQPGDEFALGGKTWSVWPIFAGYADRIGIAIPKE